MDNYRLRGTLVKLESRLSDNDRKRLHFFLGDNVPRRIRDDPSLGGTLSLMESLFDQDKINEQNFTFLINAFDEIQCIDAVKLLREHMRRIQADDVNQSVQSLASIMPSNTEYLLEDDELDKYTMRTRLIPEQHGVSSTYEMTGIHNRKATAATEDVDHQTSQFSQKSRSKTNALTWMCFSLLGLLLLVLGLIGGTVFIRRRWDQLETEMKIKDESMLDKDKQLNATAEKLNSLLSTDNETSVKLYTLRLKHEETLVQFNHLRSANNQTMEQLSALRTKDNNTIQGLRALQSANNQQMEQLNHQLDQLSEELKNTNLTAEQLKTVRSANNRTIEQLKKLLSENNETVEKMNTLLRKDSETIQQLIALRSANNYTIQQLNAFRSRENETIQRLDNLQLVNNRTIEQLRIVLSENNDSIHRLNALQAMSNQTIERLSEQLHQASGDLKNRNLTIEELKTLRLMDNRNAQKLINELQQSLAELNRSYNNIADSYRAVDSDSPSRQAPIPIANIKSDTRWKPDGITVAGGRGEGNDLDSLNSPFGFDIDTNQTVVVADYYNHRVVEFRTGAIRGELVAAGNDAGSRTDQLNYPTDVMLDIQADRMFICDRENQRIVQWSRHGGKRGTTVISNVKCFGLTMDERGFLYVSDLEKHEVTRWWIGDSQGTSVAGGNGAGFRLDQLDSPHYVFVDHHYSVYVSDSQNHRVMKWTRGAKQGAIVAGGRGDGDALTQLSSPEGIFVDQLGTVYVADCGNNRLMRWNLGATQGSVIAGGHDYGKEPNQLNYPMDLSIGLDGSLYVVDSNNNRVQKFAVDQNPST